MMTSNRVRAAKVLTASRRPPHEHVWLNLVAEPQRQRDDKGDTIQSSVCAYSMLTNVNSQYCCTFSKTMSIHIATGLMWFFFCRFSVLPCEMICYCQSHTKHTTVYSHGLTNQNDDVNITSLFFFESSCY